MIRNAIYDHAPSETGESECCYLVTMKRKIIRRPFDAHCIIYTVAILSLAQRLVISTYKANSHEAVKFASAALDVVTLTARLQAI